MGGNALKNVETRRYAAPEYHALCERTMKKFMEEHPNVIRASVIPSYRTKDSFGDMDILYSTTVGIPLSVEDIKRSFNPTEIVKNSECMSFDVEELQIDVINIDDNKYNYALNYFSWNDCGNLVGKIAHKFGLKHGHRGLTLPLRDGDNAFGEVLLTLDHDVALKFLGLDANRFNEGFDTLTDMFDWVSSSPHYHPSYYELENLNTIARVRDRKRPTYNAFLEYGLAKSGSFGEPLQGTKSRFLPLIWESFPSARADFEQQVAELSLNKYLKTKFNGDIVSKITDLSGKQLGMFISHLRTLPMFQRDILMYLSDDDIALNIFTEFSKKP
jgi:hypothetical protein